MTGESMAQVVTSFYSVSCSMVTITPVCQSSMLPPFTGKPGVARRILIFVLLALCNKRHTKRLGLDEPNGSQIFSF